MATRSWEIDELAHAGAEHRDPSYIGGYDRKQGYPDPRSDLDEFADHGLRSDATVIDFGAGTGQFAIPAARRFKRVIAVDVSPEMVAFLRKRAGEERLDNLTCVQAGFLSYEHPGEPVDGVFTRNALHHLPDFFKGIALHRIGGMVRPSGILRLRDLVYDFEPRQADEILQRWFDAAAADPHAGYTAGEFADHVRTEFSTYRLLLEPMLVATGFEIVSVEYTRSIYAAYTCIKS